LKGSVGDTVTMKVTFTNAGPAWVMPRQGDRAVSVRITLPAGTSVVKRGWFCRPKGKAYVCGMRSLDEGSGETYTFKLKIDKHVPNARGEVSLSTEPRPFDPDKTNDKAAITLAVTGGGETTTPTSSASPGGPTPPENNEPTTNGETLAATGSSTL